ncbi:unnamed protein product [Closterium sp. NIES-65]|nr:unnamed protein product [Closterium sp. NIES-65]
MAVVFDTLQNDAGKQRVGLSINGAEEPFVKRVSPFAFTDGNAYTVWVDYEPGDPGTIQVFLANSNVKPEEPLLQGKVSLRAVLQPGVKQLAFSFGFVASTTVKPFQLQGILFSSVQTGKASLGQQSMTFVLLFLVSISTVAPSPKEVQVNKKALGLSLSEATFAPSRASPFSRYVSADFKLSATKVDSWSNRDDHTWDSVPFLNWPVKNQNDCNACWAYAVVASVEAAYGIAKHQSAPQLAVEALFALMGLSDSDKCSAGGSPTQALEQLVALDGSSGLTGVSDHATTYPVQAFERAQFKGYFGLILAVQRQPVVVHIEASAPNFMQYDGTYKYQDPGCYTGSLNHVVLVIGYFITRYDGSQNRIAPPFWIIRNSWGEEWGNRGHMRMDIQGGDGVCGINVLPGIYPIVKIPGDPCGENSYKGDGDLQPSMNPCGRFHCQQRTASSNNCTCNIPDTNGIDCSKPLPKGSVLQLAGTPATPCTAFFYSLNEDTCESISTALNMEYEVLAALNPGLDCSTRIKAGRSVCLERSAAFAFTVPECVKFGTLTPRDTCSQLLKSNSKRALPSEADPNDNSQKVASANENPWAALYRNNPGLTCSATIPSSASAIGSNIGVQVCLRAEYWPFTMGICKKGRIKPVKPSMACSATYRFYGGASASPIARFYEYNGRSCSGTVAEKSICVPS